MTATARKPEVVVVHGSTVVQDVHATLDGCWTSHNHLPEEIRVQLGIAVDMPDVFADRGRGLALMRAVLGRLSYQRANNHNHWRLISRPFG